MQQLVSRYRDRRLNLSSDFQTLSISRQKHLQTEDIKKSQIHQEQQSVTKFTQKLPPKQTQSTHIKQSKQSKQSKQKQKQKDKKLSQTNLKSSRKHTIITNSKSQQKLSRKTPKKSNPPTINTLNESYSDSILELINQQKNILLINKDDIKERIKKLLEEYFQRRVQISNIDELVGNKNLVISNIVRNGYSASNMNVFDKLQSSSIVNNQTNPMIISSKTDLQSYKFFQSELEKRYSQSEKENQYLKSKIDLLTKKCDGLTKQLQKYSKIQKLISNTIESQNETRKQIIRLRRELQVSELKNNQQQKIFRRELGLVQEILQQLKQQLPRVQENSIKSSRQKQYIIY